MNYPVQNALFIAEHDMDFGSFKFYKNLIIGKINPGSKVTFEQILPLLAIWPLYYNETEPMVYLSDRQSSYSLDPTMHFEIQKLFPFLLGYGIIVYNEINYRVAQLEQQFLSCPTGIFKDLESAVEWAQGLIQQRQLG
ncbi:MAG: hypothetical protein RLZZ241_1650 [Bacteroidota bacterium]|jgi:hypothetical protein